MGALLPSLFCSVVAFGQKPEYEFYFPFRTGFAEKAQEGNHWSLTKVAPKVLRGATILDHFAEDPCTGFAAQYRS